MNTAKNTRKVSPSSRACDNCRRKRARCNGPRTLNRICSPCLASGLDCTYQDPAPPRVITVAYVKSLEERLAKAEILLKKLRSENDTSEELGFLSDNTNPIVTDSPRFVAMTPNPLLSPVHDSTPPPSDDESLEPVKLKHTEASEQPGVNDPPNTLFGKSSVMSLVQNMYDLKSDLSGGPRRLAAEAMRRSLNHRDPHWSCYWDNRRRLSLDALRYGPFPETDLLSLLVAHYFSEVNITVPLLHQASFERAVQGMLHFSDGGFARVLLLVCAVGARYLEDDRVLLENGSRNSAGWKWFEQAQSSRLHLLVAPSLYDMQAHCLTIEYLHGSSTPYCWSLTAIGIRMMQDIGANRRIVYGQQPNASDELWKRVFWILLIYDRFHSRGLGRSCALPEEDYDVDLPLDCDDEYWEHEDPAQAFKQPTGKPSKISAFIAACKLQPIMALALRSLFSLSRSRATLGFHGLDWKQNMVAHLDSSLNSWLDSLPEHLQWNSENGNDTFERARILLRCAYYSAQLTVHREFISPRGELSLLNTASRTVCRSAARSCIQVLHRCIELGHSILPMMIPVMFTSGVVIVLSMWGRMASDPRYDTTQDTETISLCVEMLDYCQFRCHLAGRHRDILRELAAFDGAPPWMIPPTPSSYTNTVERDDSVGYGSMLQDPARNQNPAHCGSLAYSSLPYTAPETRYSLDSPPDNSSFTSGVTPFVSEGEIAMWSSTPSMNWSDEWERWIRELSAAESMK